MAWMQQYTEDGHCYYENYITGESQWEKPDDWTEATEDDEEPPPPDEEEDDDDIVPPPPPVKASRTSSVFGSLKQRLSASISRR
eukprot:CAMPEP_0182514918 /NCGR_PEP_ID=MMETSP1321-20130603/36908_1 /TAXON_ID=91990 /ORGANISM="Bolidomonas sp., Strain RCC1657" /LENGTH=83 /DNA_ID=CAMNT_0024722235 /DNA_START=33 /DNA_END=281 /DNA_ORIENTATION=+